MIRLKKGSFNLSIVDTERNLPVWSFIYHTEQLPTIGMYFWWLHMEKCNLFRPYNNLFLFLILCTHAIPQSCSFDLFPRWSCGNIKCGCVHKFQSSADIHLSNLNVLKFWVNGRRKTPRTAQDHYFTSEQDIYHEREQTRKKQNLETTNVPRCLYRNKWIKLVMHINMKLK